MTKLRTKPFSRGKKYKKDRRKHVYNLGANSGISENLYKNNVTKTLPGSEGNSIKNS